MKAVSLRTAASGPLLVLLNASVPALAQDAAKQSVQLTAPVKLTGRWDFNRGQAANAWSVDIRKIDENGRIEGTVTYWGVRCKAHDTPLKEGSWRDSVLKLRVNGGADCGDMHFELKPGDRRLLEGVAAADFDPNIRTVVWLDRR